MTTTAPELVTPDPTVAPELPAPVAEQTPPPTTSAAPASPWDDPAAAKAEIERLRKEAGAERVNAKKQAADDARAELTQSLAKALGIVQDDAPIDPAQLTQELTAAQTAAQQARVELAVYRAADAVKGDPSALLDSTSFLKSLEGIDPTDTAAVTAAITAAVTANPRLGADTEPRPPAPNPAQGAATPGAPGFEAAIEAATKARDFQRVIRLKNEQAQALKPKS